jgi:type I restriction enzyme, S subunit
MSDSLPLRTLSEMVSLQKTRVRASKDSAMPYVGLEHMETERPDLIGWSSSESSVSTNSVFERDDVLFGKLRPNLRKCVLAPFAGYCSTDIVVLHPQDDVDPSFAAKVLQSDAVFRRAVATAIGTKMPRTSWSALENLRVFSPDGAEQFRVAAILDAVDDAIRTTEGVIAKLKQIEQGLLHDLLTRGVDDGGQLRPPPDESPDLFNDSPVGRIPKSWDCSSVDSAFDVQPGLTLGPHRVLRNSPFPYLRVANVFKGYLDLSDIASLNARPFEVAHQLLRAGDLLLVEGHANIEEIGRVALADERVAGFTYQNHLLRLRPHTLEPDYCELWLNGPWVRSYWRRMCSTSSGLNTINQHTLKAIPVPTPSWEERGRITATAEMCSTRVSTESAVLAKYRSLKAGLMNDLLTGRVRLRGSAEPRA